MMNWMHWMSWGERGWAMGLIWVLWIAIIAALVYIAYRWARDAGPSIHGRSAQEILDRRFASGEIGREEYESRSAALRHTGANRPDRADQRSI